MDIRSVLLSIDTSGDQTRSLQGTSVRSDGQH